MSSEWIKHLLLDAYWINDFLYREEIFTILHSSLNPQIAQPTLKYIHLSW